MKKLKKTIIAMMGIATFVLLSTTGSMADSKSGTLVTTGGRYNKNWLCSISSTTISTSSYALTSIGTQKDNYVFASVSDYTVLFCNSGSNKTETVTGNYVDKISKTMYATTSESNGKGYTKITVADSNYGYGTIELYN